ncbi:MAG: restriction endonuclease [Bacteroidia bacterium]|nr:restriction endonuclease [Bacteroidia bacterium]
MESFTHSIIKSDGSQVPFLPERLIESLERVGANEGLIRLITEQVSGQLRSGTKSSEIYRLVYQELKRRSRPLAAKYKLKRAIQELGPSGFPFEAYIGEIFRYLGYEVQVGVTLQGRCVSHEVDVLADRKDRRVFVECKFGNTANKKVDVKVALYIHSRVQDLNSMWRKEERWATATLENWIVTNGEFTEDAVKYGICSGLHLVSWRFPQQGNLKDLIENSGLYPITALGSITQSDQQHLLSRGIVLARDLLTKPFVLEDLHLPASRIERCLEEVRGLCVD